MRARFLAPLFLLAPLASCGPSASTTTLNKPTTPPVAAKPAAAVETPARWGLHATRLGNLRARLDLGSAVLYGGDGGERWLDKKDGTAPTPGAVLLPESIVGIAKGPGKGVVIVGATGTVYVASDPLGAVDSKHAPSMTLRSPAAGRAAIVAIADGGLMRTTDGGVAWNKIGLPGLAGTLVQVAMNDGGLGIALAAPQRVWATDDDGATWKPLSTPGVGARRVVHDVNGDLMLEGIEASGLLRTSPLRLERVARAPKSDGFDLAVAPTAAIPSYARAINLGRGAFIGNHYLEAIPEPDDPTRWRVAYGKLGDRTDAKKLTELNGCERVWVTGDAFSLFLVCDDRGGGKTLPVVTTKSAAPPFNAATIRIYRSDDEGKTWREDGNAGSRRAETGHAWLAPDRALVIDGACKRLRNQECYSSPPLVRLQGQKSFAKLGLPAHVETVTSMAFSGSRAYALGRAPAGPLALLVSANGRDFTKVSLPPVPASDSKQTPLSAVHAQPGTVSVDASGSIVATAAIGGEWVIYNAKEDGTGIEARRFPYHADALSMAGRRGFAWARDGRGWETSDGGATWATVSAPSFSDLPIVERTIACGAYGCLLGDRAVRIGWGGATTAPKADPAAGKVLARGALTCTAEGDWKPLGSTIAAPSAYDAEVSAGTRWVAIRHDANKGNVAVVLGKTGAKGIEIKEVTLFGPSGKDVATAVLPQIEGAAAIRFAFKREAGPKVDPKGAKEKDPKKKVATAGPVIEAQKVDVEVAWYVAATGAVHHATIKGAGPLDPRDVIGGFKDGAAGVNPGLISIAQGGVHVRPFATKPDVPLWFVRENGKVDRMPWPELPTKDVAGGQLSLRIDAIRAAGRSVILGVAGAQLLMSWANENGTGWETRTWGLWPELRTNIEPSWDFSYVGIGAATRPAIVVQWPGTPSVPAVSWGVPLKGVEVDPSEVLSMPTQKTLADPEVACGATDTGSRVVVPFSTGTRHPITITGEDPLLATSAAVLRGDGKSACVLAYEAKAISKAKSDKAKTDDGALSAIVPWGDRDHSYLFRTTLNGDTSVRALKCATSKDLPGGLSGIEGFEER